MFGCSVGAGVRVASASATMGDYRNELQSALAQLEALRVENASLRARLRPGAASPAREDSDPGLPRPAVTAAPPPRSLARQALALTAGCVLVAAALTLARPRHPPPEVPLRMPDAPAVPVVGPAGPLPMPPTTVRLPERPRPPGGAVEDVEEHGLTLQPSHLQPAVGFDRARWQDVSRGLYVLTTVPDAECSVGGVRFASPRPVFLEPGEYTVRCEAGPTRQRWSVRVAANLVTFDLEHRIGR